MSEKFVGAVAVKAVIKHNDAVLLMQDAYDHKWQFPGGRMHTSEKPAETVRREVLEELGVEVEPVSVVQADVFVDAQGESRLVLMYLCRLLGAPGTLRGDNKEVQDFRWVGLEDVDTLDIWPTYIETIQKVLRSS